MKEYDFSAHPDDGGCLHEYDLIELKSGKLLYTETAVYKPIFHREALIRGMLDLPTYATMNAATCMKFRYVWFLAECKGDPFEVKLDMGASRAKHLSGWRDIDPMSAESSSLHKWVAVGKSIPREASNEFLPQDGVLFYKKEASLIETLGLNTPLGNVEDEVPSVQPSLF